MDESQAVDEEAAVATPIFSVYRRGYDPEQVDRYVTDQQHRLDEAVHRASESERKLAAAVGQLRELHRRVAVYESEARNAQPPQLDTLGERVQRILQEAWEGAYTLRQEAEREVSELREQTTADVEAMRLQARTDVEQLREVASKEAAEVVDEATRRALHIRDETERRRQAYLERVERDREQAVAQITYLYDQRQGAIAELARLQASVQATVEEMVRSPLGRPAPGVMKAAGDGAKAARLAGASARAKEPVASSGAPGATGPDPHADRAAWAEPVPRAVEAPHLPGVLGGPSVPAGGSEEGSDVLTGPPTGPMERYVRPSDRDAARAAVQRGPGAEADAMERVMRKGLAPPAAGGFAGTGIAAGEGPGPTASWQPAPELGQSVGEVPGEASARDADAGGPAHETGAPMGRGAVLGGLIRPRRQPKARGVFDVEQDG
jgi:hypothetical protein